MNNPGVTPVPGPVEQTSPFYVPRRRNRKLCTFFEKNYQYLIQDCHVMKVILQLPSY